MDGEACTQPVEWRDNIAHSVLVGVGLLPDKGDGHPSGCQILSGFR